MVGKLILVPLSVSIGIAGAGVIYLVIELYEAVYSKITGRLSLTRKLKRQRKSSKNLVGYLVEIRQASQKNRELVNGLLISLATGAVFAFIVPGLLARVFAFFIGFSVGTILNFFMSRYQGRINRMKKLKEAVLIYDTIDIYTDTGESLPSALEKVLPSLDVLKSPVEKFIKEYPYGPTEAVVRMEKEMGIEEAGILASVMLQVMRTGSIGEISSAEGVRMENIRKTAYRADIAVRPIYRQVVLFLPLGLALTLVLYILGKHAVSSLMFMNAGQYL